jgi:8-oxo-dGTP pyrophosphatase MutT (NUDIX family)/predicted RNA binding protein YcfA (HicA-like mRNA interferase family)
MENWYSFVERIQKINLKSNTDKVVNVIFRAVRYQGKVSEIPQFEIEFNPLWSLSEKEQAEVELKKSQAAYIRAQTAKLYIDAGVVGKEEVRRSLASDNDFDVEKMLDEQDIKSLQLNSQNILTNEPEPFIIKSFIQDGDTNLGVGILVVKDGKVLVGTRSDTGELAGPGGHIQDDETTIQAAIRETQEEFGITPILLVQVEPFQFVCTEFQGEVNCLDGEMSNPTWLTLEELNGENLFKPFEDSLKYVDVSFNFDGGPNSGRYPKGSGKLKSKDRKGKTAFPAKNASGKEVASFLEKHGFIHIPGKDSSHKKYRHPDGRQTEVVIHKNDALPPGTLRKIKKDAGF